METGWSGLLCNALQLPLWITLAIGIGPPLEPSSLSLRAHSAPWLQSLSPGLSTPYIFMSSLPFKTYFKIPATRQAIHQPSLYPHHADTWPEVALNCSALSIHSQLSLRTKMLGDQAGADHSVWPRATNRLGNQVHLEDLGSATDWLCDGVTVLSLI